MNSLKYVLIGNSAAAIGCIEGIRSTDLQGEITVISDEPHHTYGRPLISYLLEGKTDEQRMKYRPDDFYEKNGCTTLFGRTVKQIDAVTHEVVLENGDKIPYDKLLVATGSRAFVPPMEGLNDVKKKFSFMTLDDAHSLAEAIDPKSRVLIVGAGLIGLKCAEAIYKRVATIAVVDLAGRVLPSVLDERASEIVKRHIERDNIKFFLADSVAKFEETKATLKSNTEIEFDVLVLAVGVRPNAELIKDAGGKVNRGIVIDSDCKTSLEDIYAAGDCCECYDISSGESRVLALLPLAYTQGHCAGVNMAQGSELCDKSIPINALGLFGLHMVTAGSYVGESHVMEKNGTYKKLVVRDGYLKGFIILGDVSRAGIYTSLIREQTPLEEIDFELIKQKPQLMAFSKVERARALGGK